MGAAWVPILLPSFSFCWLLDFCLDVGMTCIFSGLFLTGGFLWVRQAMASINQHTSKEERRKRFVTQRSELLLCSPYEGPPSILISCACARALP